MRALMGTEAALVEDLALACFLRLDQELGKTFDTVKVDEVLRVEELAFCPPDGVEHLGEIRHGLLSLNVLSRLALVGKPRPDNGRLLQHDDLDPRVGRFAYIL